MKDIKFVFNEPIPEEIENKSLEEVFKIVIEKCKKIREKIGTNYSREIEKTLSKDEIMYLRINKMFAELIKGNQVISGIGY